MMLAMLYGLFAACALWRVRGHREGAQIAGALMGALVVAALLPALIAKPMLAAALALVEAVLALWLLSRVVHWRGNCGGAWCTCSLRAMAIGIICLGKIALWTVYTGTVRDLGWWNWYAAGINGGFVAQAAIAGGFCDGLGNRIHDFWHRLVRGGARHLGGAGGAR